MVPLVGASERAMIADPHVRLRAKAALTLLVEMPTSELDARTALAYGPEALRDGLWIPSTPQSGRLVGPETAFEDAGSAS
ncbi:hypothetical protein [Methylobacterium sp. SI9]|uniref:hypothetical protein n=1 Tax=Methylobacterium guangdongense TaxID=3138811 RepID=UPI00313AFDF6